MKVKVKKGLERNLKILGMTLKYFYTWSITGVALVLFVLSLIMDISRKESTLTGGIFIFLTIFALLVFIILKVLFTKLSVQKREKGTKEDIHLSNKKL
jgi:lipopolysaccharide export LptBFGC system permease protein LptF